MRKLHPVKVGNLTFDGKKIYIQSMLNVIADDVEGNVRQAMALEEAGCEIIRVAVPDMVAAKAVADIKKQRTGYPCLWLRISISIIRWRWNVPQQAWIRYA